MVLYSANATRVTTLISVDPSKSLTLRQNLKSRCEFGDYKVDAPPDYLLRVAIDFGLRLGR